MELIIPKCRDFTPDGCGRDAQWQQMAWQPLVQVGEVPALYQTQSKVLYSDRGLYFLVYCQDQRLVCTQRQDFDDLWEEDVVEVFLWPHEDHPLYFEYEISPLGKELVIMVPNHKGTFMGWQAWHYEGERKIIKAVSVSGGPQQPGAQVESWTVEFFVPFVLLKGLGNVPPQPGMRWRANIYRMDYHDQRRAQWAWCPDTGGEFHRYQDFGTFVFE